MEDLTFELEPDELEIFTQDVNDHLQTMESGLLSLERGGEHEQATDPETLNAVFRAAHTLKAVAGVVGHIAMAELTHTLETLFDAMRQGELALSQTLADEVLAAVDVLRALRDEVISRQPSGVDVPAVLSRLQALVEGEVSAQSGAAAFAAAQAAALPGARPLTPQQAQQAQDCVEAGCAILEIGVAALLDAFAPAARLLQAAMVAAEKGQIIAQHPTNNNLLDERHEGKLWLVLATQAEAQSIQALLQDVPDLAQVEVLPFELKPDRLAAVLSVGKSGAEGAPELDKTVRINVERLDALMDLVGELVTDRTRLAQTEAVLIAQYGKGESLNALNDTIAHVGQIVDQLQDEVMRARLLPISYLFDKFPRLVRDIAREAGKQVNLIMEGEATELDRSIIEAIGDPLVHVLRNAVDHGIELPGARVAAGKPAMGTVRLAAKHAEGQIVITVSDDGRGIDPAQTRRAAVSHGLLSEEEAARLTDDEAVALIFRPGLSTAERVTGVSGRGVGLDVVRTNINQVGGSVVVDSEIGRGVTFRIMLPLTLAIVQTMLVALRGDVYAIPLTSIIESLYLADVQVSGIKGNPATRWRDKVLPLLRLRQFFNVQSHHSDQEPGKAAVVVAAWGKLQAGLIVDRIIGKQEIVVKPLGPIVGTVPGLSGCTILGDGRIALIVDVPGLINVALQASR